MAGFRDVLIHDYDTIDVNEVWRTVERDLLPLKLQIAAILAELEDE